MRCKRDLFKALLIPGQSLMLGQNLYSLFSSVCGDVDDLSLWSKFLPSRTMSWRQEVLGWGAAKSWSPVASSRGVLVRSKLGRLPACLPALNAQTAEKLELSHDSSNMLNMSIKMVFSLDYRLDQLHMLHNPKRSPKATAFNLSWTQINCCRTFCLYFCCLFWQFISHAWSIWEHCPPNSGTAPIVMSSHGTLPSITTDTGNFSLWNTKT